MEGQLTLDDHQEELHYLIDSLTKVTIRMSRHRDPFLFPHLLYHLDPSPLSLLPQPAKAKFHHKFKGLVS